MNRDLIKKAIERLNAFWKDPFFLGYWDAPYMRRGPRDNQLAVRISGRTRRRAYPYHGDGWLFVDDMYLGITPIGVAEETAFVLNPPTQALIEIVAEGVSHREFRRELSEAVSDFVRTAAHTLFQDGEVFYEIVDEKDATGRTTGFSLEYVVPYYLFSFFKNYYQIIPWWEARESRVRVQIVKIPKDKIIRVSMPKVLVSKSYLQSVLKRLYKLSREILPAFIMEAREAGEEIAFDFERFRKDKYLEAGRLTKKFGWSQRQQRDDRITEYYMIFRNLVEKRAQALVRKEIISEINKALSGARLNLGVQIEMRHMPTVEDIDAQEQLLKQGNVAFMDIFNATSI